MFVQREHHVTGLIHLLSLALRLLTLIEFVVRRQITCTGIYADRTLPGTSSQTDRQTNCRAIVTRLFQPNVDDHRNKSSTLWTCSTFNPVAAADYPAFGTASRYLQLACR